MKTNHLPFKVGAVLLALALGGGYVYDRAGGNLLPKLGFGGTPAPQPQATEKTPSEEPVEAKATIYGSKSAPVFLPSKEATPVVAQEATPQPTTLLPGSKSLILAPPPAANQSAPSQELPQAQPVETTNDNSNPPPRLLPGSKSRAVFEPEPPSAPNSAPAQQQAVQKPASR